MAESSSSTTNNNNGSPSPIASLAQDHLFSILLRLPVDSILSFAMTCKRFRSLASSDTLWESLCRRDWGHKQVDAFKYSCNQYRMMMMTVPWMRLYRQVTQLESLSCRNISDPDGDLVLPNPRASHSLNFVSNCLVLFGGGCEGGQFKNHFFFCFICSYDYVLWCDILCFFVFVLSDLVLNYVCFGGFLFEICVYGV